MNTLIFTILFQINMVSALDDKTALTTVISDEKSDDAHEISESFTETVVESPKSRFIPTRDWQEIINGGFVVSN